MELENRTGLPARMFRGEPEPNVMFATVVAKASYRIGPSGLRLEDADSQPIFEEDCETPLGTLPSDQVPMKAGVDLLVLGSAYAPHDRPTSSMEVALRLGTFERRLLVFGDREWDAAARPTAPRAFLKLPLTYANAFGGVAEMRGRMVPYPDNPLGKGFVLEESKACGQPLPNIEWPDLRVHAWSDTPPPAGFAPFPRQSRIHMERSFQVGGAEEFSFEYLPGMYSAAHPEMIVPNIDPGLQCTLLGMTREGSLTFRIPSLRLELQVTLGESISRLPLQVDTVCIVAEERRLVLTSRASFRYRFVAEQVRHTTVDWHREG